jgi:plasmid replication initiation protein
MVSMEHPLFALRAGDKEVRSYQSNGTIVTVKPGSDGCATIFDKDIWIYCISKLVEAQNKGLEIDRTVHFVAYDFLCATERRTSGREYSLLTSALKRLKGTTVETNIKTEGIKENAGFGLIDSWQSIRADDGRMIALEVVLPDWLFRSIKSMRVLTLSREYFELRRPLHRRLYELARKYCGHQSRWPISMEKLHKKSGSRASLRRFRFEVKALAESGDLPEYYVIYYPKRDNVVFYPWGKRGVQSHIQDIINDTGKPPELPCG